MCILCIQELLKLLNAQYNAHATNNKSDYEHAGHVKTAYFAHAIKDSETTNCALCMDKIHVINVNSDALILDMQ